MFTHSSIRLFSVATVLGGAGSVAAQTLDSPVLSSGGSSATGGSVFVAGQFAADAPHGVRPGAVYAWDPFTTLRTIRNGLLGDGILSVTLDAYGSIQTFSDLSNEDTFDPFGASPAAHPTFSSGLFVFIGASQRELLSASAAWQNFDFTGGGDPSEFFSADASLARSVTDCCTQTDTNADGVLDRVASAFSITGIGVSMHFELVQSISEPDAGSAAYLRQDYTITNQNTVPVNVKLVRSYDGDMPWTGNPSYYADDWVGAGRTGGAWYVFQQEPGDPHQAVTLSSLTPPDAYFGAKTGIDPDGPGGDPAFTFGTSNQVWDVYGIPTGWRNYLAGVGRDNAGVSGSAPPGSVDPYDAFMGLQFVLTLPPGQPQTLTLVHSYGSVVPLLAPPGCPGDVDGDNVVSLTDLATLLANFGTITGALLEDGDLDSDGDVELSDLAILLANFGTTCP